MSKARAVALAAGGVALAAAGGVGGWALGGGDRTAIPRLERRITTLETDMKRASGERDRLKAERDRLERQLAASQKTPRACPSEALSTADAHLFARFSVEYPCGWSVLEEPLQTPQGDPDLAGLTVDHLFFSALPISKTPREGPLTEITLDTWYDDPNVEGDALPAHPDWVTKARNRFTQVAQFSLKTRSAIPVTKLVGQMLLFDSPQPAVLYVWEFTDPQGDRKILEAFALDPSEGLKRTLEALVRSFLPLSA